MNPIFGILLALACALTTNVGFLFKHRGACAAPAVDFRHPLRTGKSLFSSRLFALGMLIAAAAWVFHVAALAVAPLSIVQAVLAGGVVLLAVMAERSFGLQISRRQWTGIVLTAVGLLILGFSLPAVHGAHSRFSVPGMIGFEFGLLAVGTLLIMGPRIGAPAHHQGFMLGAASGILFGVSDVAIKAMSGMVGSHGLVGLVTPWLLVDGRRLGGRLLQLGQGSAGRRCRSGHRGDRNRRQRGRESSGASSCSAIRSRAIRSCWSPRCSPSRWCSWPPG